ncbi:MAG: hypothetical protein AAFO94_08685, partial [Bacteroidota bacterium]
MMMKPLRLLLLLLIGLGSVSEVAAENASADLVGETSSLFTPLFNDTLVSQDSFFIVVSDCAAGADLCIDIPKLLDTLDVQVNGLPYSGTAEDCNVDTIFVYSYSLLLGGGMLNPHFLHSWQVNATTFSGSFGVITDLVDSMNVWDPTGNWEINETEQLITGGDAANTYTDMDIEVVVVATRSLLGVNEQVEPRGTELNFAVGLNEVILTDEVTGCTDTFMVNVVCATPATINRSVDINETGTYCIDFSELPGSTYMVSDACASAGGSSVDFQFVSMNTCVEYRGLASGVDSMCIVACDEFNVCDTTYLIVEVTGGSGGSVDYIDEVFVGQSGEHCLRRDFFVGTPDTIYNLCGSASGANTSFVVDTATYCVTYTGNTVGGLDSACYVLCDEFDICDTTYMVINVASLPGSSRDIVEEVLVGASGTICLDTSILAGNLEQFFNDCSGSGGMNIQFDLDIDNYCVTYTALSAGGPEQACMIIRDDLGGSDTTNIIITATMPMGNSQEIYDTLFLNTSGQICIDTTVFAGLVDTVYNGCPDASGAFTTVTVDPVTFCVDYTATAAGGPDTACIYLENTLGTIDTTFIYLTVTTPQTDTVEQTVLIGETQIVCLDTTELGGTIIDFKNDCVGASGTLVTFTLDPTTYCVEITGATIGKQDTACFVLTDDRGVTDTTTYIVEVRPPTPEIVFDTIVPLQTKTFCLDTDELLMPVDTIYSICAVDADTNATVVLDSTTYCVSYTGLVGKENGSDTLCYVLCNDRNICDTSYIYIYNREVVLTPSFLYDTITVNNSATTCLSSDELPTAIDSIYNDCP